MMVAGPSAADAVRKFCDESVRGNFCLLPNLQLTEMNLVTSFCAKSIYQCIHTQRLGCERPAELSRPTSIIRSL